MRVVVAVNQVERVRPGNVILDFRMPRLNGIAALATRLNSPGPRRPMPSDTNRWVRRALAVAVPIVAVNSVFTAFADNMPASHHVAALIAAPIFVAAWLIELSSLVLPPLILIAAMVVPNLWLTLIGHNETNLLFLALLVGWVAYVGTRAQGLIALALAFLTISIGELFIVAPTIGAVPWESWTEWSFSLALTWFLGFSLRRQERLVVDLDQRSQELEMLLSVSGSVASTLDMRPLLEAVFDALGRVLDYSAIAVLVLNEAADTLTVAARRGPRFSTSQAFQQVSYPVADLGPDWERLRRDEPIVMPDVRGNTADASVFRDVLGEQPVQTSNSMWVPLVVRGQITGLLIIANAEPAVFSIRDTTLALGIARQAAVAIENARLLERARQAAVLEERQRLSRELHDSVTQSLYGISLYAEAAGRALSSGETQPVATNLQEIRETTQEALSEMRLLLFELRPPVLQEAGLGAAVQARLQAVEARTGLLTDFDCQYAGRLSPEIEQELYRVVQEALNNVLKHAHAARVRVALRSTNDTVSLEIADDGLGFEPSMRSAEGFGLRGMRERVERLGGTLRIESQPGGGTRVTATVTIDHT